MRELKFFLYDTTYFSLVFLAQMIPLYILVNYTETSLYIQCLLCFICFQYFNHRFISYPIQKDTCVNFFASKFLIIFFLLVLQTQVRNIQCQWRRQIMVLYNSYLANDQTMRICDILNITLQIIMGQSHYAEMAVHLHHVGYTCTIDILHYFQPHFYKYTHKFKIE